MSVDAALIKAGARVKTRDGREGTVKGSYMSSEGIVLTVQCGGNPIVCDNVPFGDVVAVVSDKS